MALLPRDIQLRLSQRGKTGVGSLSFACSSPDPGGTRETTLNSSGLLESPFSMFHNMGLCSRPGGGPNAWKHFGPELDPGMRALLAVYIRPLGGEEFWKGDYGGGVRVGRPFGAR